MFDANNTEHVLDIYRNLGLESTYGMSDDIVRDFIKFCRREESLIQDRYRRIEEAEVRKVSIRKKRDEHVWDIKNDVYDMKGRQLIMDFSFADFPKLELLRKITSDFEAVLSHKRTNEFNTIWNRLNAEQTHFHR